MKSLSGRLQLSDDDLFRSLAADPNAKISAAKLAETYDGYKDLHQEHSEWSKHYIIAAIFLFVSQFNIIKKLELFEHVEIQEAFIPLAALAAFIIQRLRSDFWVNANVPSYSKGCCAGAKLKAALRKPAARKLRRSGRSHRSRLG
jgi:hypothetical protein